MSSDQHPVVTEIHIAPGSRLPMKSVDSVTAEEDKGILGDRYHGTKHRHVTLQSRTGLDEAAEKLGSTIPSAGTRRNVTLSYGVVPTKPGTLIRLGEAQLQVVRVAAPCRLLDDSIGPGAMEAMRRRGGAVCRVLSSGMISVGDPAVWSDDEI